MTQHRGEAITTAPLSAAATTRPVARYQFAAAALAAAGITVALVSRDPRWLVVGLAGAAAVPVALIDILRRRVPNLIVAWSAFAISCAAAIIGVIDGRNPTLGILAGAALAAGPLLTIHLINPTAIGFGDVKFAAVAGALVGILDWSMTPALLLAACLIGLTGATLRTTWRRSVPFAACLSVATFIVAIGCLTTKGVTG